MPEKIETYNLINYLKIIDLSLLNLFDYSDIENKSLIIEENGKLILNFNSSTKKILESLIVRNINDSVIFNNINIVVNTCSPKNNWRNNNNLKENQKYIVKSDSIYIDNVKLNIFANELFKKLENTDYFNLKSKNILLQNKIKFIEFESIDIYDSFNLIKNILLNFGNLNEYDFNYNIISDGNHNFKHNELFVNELSDKVRIMLINKGVI